MPVNVSFRRFVEEQLERIVPVQTRSMFGGVGIYAQGRFFALIADDILYLKVNDQNRPDFESAGMKPFQPYGDKTRSMSYYPLPGGLLEDVDRLEPWVRKALAAAERKAAR